MIFFPTYMNSNFSLLADFECFSLFPAIFKNLFLLELNMVNFHLKSLKELGEQAFCTI